MNGFALGGGTELLLALDIRILADSARLGLPEITLGLFPGAGGTQRIFRQVPLCLAKELRFTGALISAEEAVAIGLANRVVRADELMHEVLALARQIAERSPLVLKLLKRTLREGADMAALLSERLGDGPTDSAARPGHERPLAAKSQVQASHAERVRVPGSLSPDDS